MSKTEVLFCFDTEDYTSNMSLTSIKYTADILNAEGVRGNYQMVGHVARKLVEYRRFDVLDALKLHVINTHTKAHSLHPNITEYTDIEDMDKAIELAVIDEGEGIGMIKAATGVERVLSAVPPGNSLTAAGLYAYAKLGLKSYSDAPARMPGRDTVWFCGLISMSYGICMDSIYREDYDEAAMLDRIATFKRCLLYHHPGMAEHTTHWDIVNYNNGNHAEWEKWEQSPLRPTEDTVRFYQRFASLVRAIKNDDRFRITDTERFIEENNRSRTVKREDMPKYLAALKAEEESGVIEPLVFSRGDGFEHISISECLYAAVKMLFGADEVPLDGVIIKGFLNAPVGVPCEVKLPFDHIARSAKAIDFDKFLPHTIPCGTYRIGPMDLLMALLEAICEPSKLEFTIKPKMQQPSLDDFPYLRDLKLAGSWVFDESFEDKYTSDRLRWQAWTIHD